MKNKEWKMKLLFQSNTITKISNAIILYFRGKEKRIQPDIQKDIFNEVIQEMDR